MVIHNAFVFKWSRFDHLEVIDAPDVDLMKPQRFRLKLFPRVLPIHNCSLDKRIIAIGKIGWRYITPSMAPKPKASKLRSSSFCGPSILENPLGEALQSGLQNHGLACQLDTGIGNALYVRSLSGFAPHWRSVRDPVEVGQVAVVVSIWSDTDVAIDAFRRKNTLPVDQILEQLGKRFCDSGTRFVAVLVRTRQSDKGSARFFRHVVAQGWDFFEASDQNDAVSYILQMIAAIDSAADKKTLAQTIFSAKPQKAVTSLNDPVAGAWVSMLIQIPGFSEQSARAISCAYPTPSLFLFALRSNPTFEDVLSNLELTRTSSGVRRLGPAKAKLLVSIFSEDESSTDIRF